METVPLVPAWNHSPASKYTAEFLGTFFLVFTIGCNVHTGSIGAALSIGSMLMVMIYALGSVSGAHLNPAVTLGVLLSGRNKIGPIDACAYMLSQCLGGICAAMMYLNVFGTAFMLRPVGPWYSTGDACAAEILYTWALVYVVLNVATASENDPNHYFGLAIGFTVAAAAVTVGSISGCSLNPAVSIGSMTAAQFAHGPPAFHFGAFYIFAPFVGAIIGVLSFYLVRRRVEYGADIANAKHRDMPAPIPPPQPVPVETRKRDMEMPMPKPAPPPEPTPALKKQVSRKLSSNELVKISDLGRNLENANLFCGLKWEVGSGSKGVDIDASCVKFDKEGRCLGAVYFADKEDHENGIRHSGDQVTGEMTTSPLDDEAISFRLSGIKPEINFLFFVATIFSSGVHSFQDVSSCSARLVDSSSEAELVKFEKSNIGTGNALVIAMIFRKAGKWHFEAVDKCYQIQEHGTYRALEPQLHRLCRQKKEMEGP